MKRLNLTGFVVKEPGKVLIPETEVERLATITGQLTPEQLAIIASQIDISGKVDKMTGYSLIANSLITNIHAAGSDNQDLSGLQPKETCKGLSTNDYTTIEKNKLSTIADNANNYSHPTNHLPSIITQDTSNRFVTDTEKTTWNSKAEGNHTHTYPAYNSVYRTILDSSGSHIAAKVAGTYGISQGNPLAVTGTGTLYALNVLYIDSADYPTIDSKATKLRVRCVIECNDVAPFTGTFTVGLHPVTRPATSGGAGVCIYTIGAAVTGSTVVGTNLAADSQNNLVGSDFALPANGFYVLAIMTSATMATSSHCHISASLQIRNN